LDANGLANAAPPVECDFSATGGGWSDRNDPAFFLLGFAIVAALVVIKLVFDLSIAGVAVVAGVTLGGALIALRVLQARRAQRSKAPGRAEAMEQALRRAPGVTAASAASRYARVRGRVRVLEPVLDPSGRKVGAFRSQSALGAGGQEWVHRRHKDTAHSRSGDTMERHHVHYGTLSVLSSKCGRFVVQDDSGVALVDDDAIEVSAAEGVSARLSASTEVWVGDGDEVDVVGPGDREPIPDGALLTGDYRDGATAFVFDGRPDNRVYVLLRRKARAER